MITEEQIIKWGGNPKFTPLVVNPFNELSVKYEVSTDKRIAAFLAQVMHESLGFKYSKEIASGKAYEGREDLGNTEHGYGVRYKGRGYLQITGYFNYEWVSESIFGDKRLIEEPELLEQPQYAMQSAFIFWNSKDLNKYSDMEVNHKVSTKKHGELYPFAFQTYIVNGGFNGLENRIDIYNKICTDLNLPLYEI